MIQLKIKKERLGPVLGRHPWIFSGAIPGRLPDGVTSGTPVKVTDEQGEFLAQGYFNSYSQIAVRIWSYDPQEIVDEKFFAQRIRLARSLRDRFIDNKTTDAYRVVNSENDLLPGLIVDKYGDYLTVQYHTAGIEAWKNEIIKALIAEYEPKGIYERSESAAKVKDGGEVKKGLVYGEVPEFVTIKENGFQFLVSLSEGQKTGFFLDQRDKRQALMKYAKGQQVLNCFSYTGGFSVYAGAAGASRIVSVDISERAVELSKENMKLNGIDPKKCEFVVADVKRYLEQVRPGEFGTVVLDPPAFVKDRRKVREGLRGYRFINETAMKIMPSEGILLTCSCSAHVSLEDFRHMLTESAGRAGRTAQIIEQYTHGVDHPELVAFKEGEYLKSLFLRII